MSKKPEFKFGIEWEFPLVRIRDSQYVDFDNTKFRDLQGIIDDLPEFKEDYPGLRVRSWDKEKKMVHRGI